MLQFQPRLKLGLIVSHEIRAVSPLKFIDRALRRQFPPAASARNTTLSSGLCP